MSHIAAFRAQADFAPEAKIKIGNDIWTPETAGSRLYAQVLSKNPGTVQKVIDLAGKLDTPLTAKQVQGHLRWMFTAGELEVDGKSYAVEPKKADTSDSKTVKAEAEKPKTEKQAKAVATKLRTPAKTKKAA